MIQQTQPTQQPEPVHRPISYRIAGAAAASGLSTSKLKRLIADGSLPSRLVDGCRIILHDDLERYLRGEL
ncbi:MAG: DNA-binding protein [Actinobacteria bacterium]|nr:DNA-binding protein [Actinomycetota bacterium]